MKSAKQRRMERLNREYTLYFKDIYKNQKKELVYGEGNLAAKIVLVGEAPGRQETVQGRPFVRQAGKIVGEFLAFLDLKRDELYITSVVKFRPFKVNPETGRISNRPPNKEEIGLSKSWLFKELYIVEPSMVVSLGNIALQTLANDTKLTIRKVHGVPMDVVIGDKKMPMMLFPLYHPASIIYRKELNEIYLEDLNRLKNYLPSS